MNLYLTLASYAIAASIGFGTAWKMQDATITQMNLEAAHEVIEAQLEARDATEQRVAAVAKAEVNAQTRIRVVATERSSADSLGDGLRVTTAETVRASSEDSAACAVHAATLGVVFDACAKELIDVSGKADEWVSEAIKQNEAAQ